MIPIGNLDLGHLTDTLNYLATLLLKVGLIDKLLLEYVGLPHVLVLTVHLVHLAG